MELDGDTVRRTLAQWRAISSKGAENVPLEGADEEWEKMQLAAQVCIHHVHVGWGVGGQHDSLWLCSLASLCAS